MLFNLKYATKDSLPLHGNKTGNKSPTHLLTFSSFSLKSKNYVDKISFFSFAFGWFMIGSPEASHKKLKKQKQNVYFHAEEIDSLKKWNAKIKFDKMFDPIANSTQII